MNTFELDPKFEEELQKVLDESEVEKIVQEHFWNQMTVKLAGGEKVGDGDLEPEANLNFNLGIDASDIIVT